MLDIHITITSMYLPIPICWSAKNCSAILLLQCYIQSPFLYYTQDKNMSGSLFKIHNYFFKKNNIFFNFILCNFLVQTLQYFQNIFFCPQKVEKTICLSKNTNALLQGHRTRFETFQTNHLS